MPTFRNLDEIKKYVEKNAGTIKLSNGKTIGQILLNESRRLKGLITKHIGIYYASYRPVYPYRDRTFDLINSLRIEDMQKNGNELTVRVYFDQQTATHPSVVKDGEPGFTPILIDQGWEVKKDVWFKDIHMFGHFEGAGFIKAAINEYNAQNPYGFKIRVEYTPYSNLNFET